MKRAEESKRKIKVVVAKLRQTIRTLACDNIENRLRLMQYDLIKISKLADSAEKEIRKEANLPSFDKN